MNSVVTDDRKMKTTINIMWSVEDVKSLRPDLTVNECREWLGLNAGGLAEHAVKYCWKLIEDRLGLKDVKPSK